ncbi:hypothetical protein J6590_086180 [Homalodisca vitripennis]|nr:hypothetical protein J6590_086180 [Homalodisca vitripennis]
MNMDVQRLPDLSYIVAQSFTLAEDILQINTASIRIKKGADMNVERMCRINNCVLEIYWLAIYIHLIFAS